MSDPDYDNLSVEELQKIARGESDPEFDSLSEEELKKLANPPGMLESGARGLAQGATLGFADEISGGAESLFTGKPYEQARNESRTNFKRAKDANPKAYLTGEIAGGVGTAVVPGLNVAKGLKGAMTLGAGIGGAAGLGASEAEDVDGMSKDMLKGAAIGTGGGLIGHGASKAVPWAAKTAGEKLKWIAEQRMVKSLGGSKKMMENLKKTPGAESRLGRNLLDNKIGTGITSKEKMADRLDKFAGSKVGDLRGALDDVSNLQGKVDPEKALALEASKFSPQEAAEALKTEMREKYSNIPEEILEPQLSTIDKWFSKPGRMDVKDAQAFKVQMNNFIRDGSYLKSNPGLAQETLKGMQGSLRKGIERNADEAANILGEQGGKIKGINQDLGGIYQGQDMLEDAISRGSKNRSVSLTDYISGNAGAAALGPQGMALGFLNKAVREKGSQVSAVALDKASKMLLRSPRMQQLANTNPPAFKAMAASFAQRVSTEAPKKVAGPGQQPVDEQEAKTSFVEGN